MQIVSHTTPFFQVVLPPDVNKSTLEASILLLDGSVLVVMVGVAVVGSAVVGLSERGIWLVCKLVGTPDGCWEANGSKIVKGASVALVLGAIEGLTVSPYTAGFTVGTKVGSTVC